MGTSIWNRRIKPNKPKVWFGFGSYHYPSEFYISRTKKEKSNRELNKKESRYPNFYNIVYILININYI